MWGVQATVALILVQRVLTIESKVYFAYNTHSLIKTIDIISKKVCTKAIHLEYASWVYPL